MSRAAATVVAVVSLALAAAPSWAREGARAAQLPAADRVALAVAAALPPGLAATQVQVAALPPGEVSVTFSGTPRPGWASVLAVVTARGREAGRGWARVELKPLRRLLVAARDLEAGEPVEGAAVRVEERAASAGEGFTGEGEAGERLVGARASHRLAAGQLLLESDVTRPAAVPRGASVRLIIRRGQVTITAAAVLERPARPGERTTARVVAVNRLVQGRLVDPGTLVEEEVSP